MARRDTLSHLVQTRLPSPVFQWLQRRADEDGDTVAGLLRRLAVREMKRLQVRAWVSRKECSPLKCIQEPAHHLLRHVRDVNETTRVYLLLGAEGMPQSLQSFVSSDIFRAPGEHAFVLEGSVTRWLLLTSQYNEGTEHIEVTLCVEPPL